jgi:N-methylhydantoinase B/oxoprolinase/acetone carboxylase alpha subunit
MGYKLMRMSYSSIIRESEDFGAALVDEQGRQQAEADYGVVFTARGDAIDVEATRQRRAGLAGT